MDILTSTVYQYLADLLLPFMRISGMFAAMVGISAKTVSPQLRALLTLFITLIIMPVIEPVPIKEMVSVSTWLLVVQQLLIGISIGFISSMVLNTFVMGGQIVAMQTGLGFASIVDPVNGINVPAVGQFYLILATLLFWAWDGHLAMIRMIVLSFDAFPIGSPFWEPQRYMDIVSWGSWMFIAAVTMSLAPIVSLLLVNLAFGVMTKAAPQLNVFSIGFSIAQIMGMVIIWISLGNFANHFESQWQRAQQLMCELLYVCP